MSIDLREELVKLLEDEGLGRIGFLRHVYGEPDDYAVGGEYDQEDRKLSDGRPYLDHEITYYKTTTMATELKTAFGPVMFSDEIIFIAVKEDQPTPSPGDSLVEIEYEKDGDPDTPAKIRNVIPINSVFEYWGNTNSKTVYYAVSSTRRRTGERGAA